MRAVDGTRPQRAGEEEGEQGAEALGFRGALSIAFPALQAC